MGELRPYPEADGDWLDTMLLLARRQLALYRRHPWLLDVVQRPTGIGPESLAWFDNCMRILQPVRRAATAKFEAIAMMTGVVSLIARSEARPGRSPSPASTSRRIRTWPQRLVNPPRRRPNRTSSKEPCEPC